MVCHRYEANASPATILKSSIAHRIAEMHSDSRIYGCVAAYRFEEGSHAASDHKGFFQSRCLKLRRSLCHHLGWQALLGIFCLASGVLFYGWSIKASLYAAQSVVTIQFVGTLLLFRERIEMRQWFGIALIVIGFSPVVRQIG